MENWIPIIGTLGGAIVAGAIVIWIEERQWRRRQQTRWDDRRFDTYARFLLVTHVASFRWTGFTSRQDFRASIEHLRGLQDETIRSMAEINLLASEDVKDAADSVVDVVVSIIECASDYYGKRRVLPWRPLSQTRTRTLMKELANRRKKFSHVIRSELGIRTR